MTDMADVKTTKDMLDQEHSFALIGLLISLFAFSLAVFTPWVYDNFAPREPVLEEVAVEKAFSMYDLLFSFESAPDPAETSQDDGEQVNEEPLEAVEEAGHWTDYWSLIVITIALVGIINGTLGSLRKGQRYIGGTAIFFGMAAIVASYMWIAFAIFVFVILVAAILVSMGVSF